MDLPSNFKIFARYNQRMNDQLMRVCEQLTTQQLHQPTGAFFPTVMDHWNHLLFGDLIMLRRLVDNGVVNIDAQTLASLPVARTVNDSFASNLTELRALRALVDRIFLDFTHELTPEMCNRPIRYTTTEGQVLERDLGAFCQHLFNHQTHHRGQLTGVLSQFGLDFGCTDLPVIVPDGDRD
ncbi:DinB family protein [Vibrio pacinii]|uniref:DinB family protein n=1 Tax=Vibrio pacinii TaxID=170674 RepID=UPI00056E057B|nr:DinB family protein [Vibrio pacinii]EHA1126866.1 damage-inducible protein DinB [Vibrio navarrensis]ELI5733391.1 DinB family protein [Vibrio fluvialis]